MKRATIASLTIGVCLGHAILASAQVPCVLSGFSPLPDLPSGTKLGLGRRVYDAALQYPTFGLAIVAARDAWNDRVNTRGRLGDWNGDVPDPDGPLPAPTARRADLHFRSAR
jgi:hypothetical protein